jgi:peptidoglycan/xylan/chitin deacetylase (PgdA/CDA1 family)
MISKSKIIQTFGPLGGYAFIRWLMRSEPRIIMFHRFSKEPKPHCISSSVLDQQLAYLKKHFNVIPLSKLRNCKEQGLTPPKNSLVLTVDDGYRDFYEVAYPLLKKHQLPATLFVTTGFVNRELWLWPDQITWILNNAETLDSELVLGGNAIPPKTINDQTRPQLWGDIVGYLLSIGDENKHEWIKYLTDALGLVLPVSAPPEYKACSWEELREMQSNGVELGGHTHTHPSLGQVSETQLQDEVSTCKTLMTTELGECARDFCFPNGQPSDYCEQVKKTVKDSGFRSSVTAFYDAKATIDAFEMRRHTASEDWFQFYKSVNGVEALMAKYRGAHNRMGGSFC